MVSVNQELGRDSASESHKAASQVCFSSCRLLYTMPQTGWLINNRNLLLTVLEAGGPRSRHLQIRRLMRAHFLVHRWQLLAESSCGGRDKGSLSGLFSKDADPIHEGSTLMTSSPPKDPTS